MGTQVQRAGLLFVLAVWAAGCGYDYAEAPNLASAGTDIVCFGDSITRGYGATDGNDYPAVLGRLLGQPVVNAGRDGDTTESAYRRLDEVLAATQPRVVIVELGGNDVLRGVPPATTIDYLDRITARCLEAGAMVVLVHAKFGLFADPLYDGFEEIAARHGVPLVENALSGILGRPSMSSDQIHPNDAGYALLAERVAEVVRPLLEAADKARR